MVSPSKYCKTPKKDYKSGIDRLKKDRKLASSNQVIFSSSANGFRPLVNKKYYLDIKSKVELTKLETTLKSCGATIEIFLTKDVDIVVTDKTSWNFNGESPLASISPLTVPSPANRYEQPGGWGVPKTRASAMIEKVSPHPAWPYYCPLELAQKWKIPIVPVANVWKWISKIRDSVVNKINTNSKVKAKKANGGSNASNNSYFIKIESLVSPNKPELQIVDDWPNLNLDGYLGQCPFRSPSPPSIESEEGPPECKILETEEPTKKVRIELIEYDDTIREPQLPTTDKRKRESDFVL